MEASDEVDGRKILRLLFRGYLIVLFARQIDLKVQKIFTGILAVQILIRVTASFFILSLSSCGFIEPKPAINSQAGHVPGLRLLVFKNGQHVAGTINLTVVPDSMPAQITQLNLSVDSTSVSPLSLNTTNFSQGDHVLHFTARLTSPTSGFVNYQNGVVDTLNVTLNFDQTPARAVSGLSVSNSNAHPVLSWSPNPFSTFLCYIVRRNNTIIDSIFSETTASFVDTGYTLADFDRVSYDVGTSNCGSVAYSPAMTFQLGQFLSLIPISGNLDYSNVTGVLENLGDKVIFESDFGILHSDFSVDFYSFLVSMSTQTHNILSQAKVQSTWMDYTPGPYAKSLDAARIFGVQPYTGTIIVLDTNLQQLSLSSVSFGSPRNLFAVGWADNLYSSDGNGTLYVYASDGTRINSYENILGGQARFLSISPDGTTMLAADNKGIKSFALSHDSVVFKLQSPIKDQLGLFHCDWNDSLVFITRQNAIVEGWDVGTLKSLGSFHPSAGVPQVSSVTALTANSRYLYVAYTVRYNNGPASIVVEYDVSTRQQTRSWIFPSVVQSLLGSEKGRYLFACTSSNQWIVDLGVGQL
ncbi:MAG TPA: hypothetical protein VLX91_04465 [Candidatus Acidoferrales bacterium]|nr:hypothetical protein [Candidatus Acidoferrales bacterium]